MTRDWYLSYPDSYKFSKKMRKVHVVMFGSQIIINIVFSLVLFNGLLGGNGIFAFVYPSDQGTVL